MASRLNPKAEPFAFTSSTREQEQHGPIFVDGFDLPSSPPKDGPIIVNGSHPPPAPPPTDTRQDSLAQIPQTFSSATDAPDNPFRTRSSAAVAVDPTTYHYPGTRVHVYLRGTSIGAIDMALGARFSGVIRSILQSPLPTTVEVDGCTRIDIDFPNADRPRRARNGLSRCLHWMYENASFFGPIKPLDWPPGYGLSGHPGDTIDLYAATVALRIEPHPDHLADILLGRICSLGYVEDLIEIALSFPANDPVVWTAVSSYGERVWDWGSEVITAGRLLTVLGDPRVSREFQRTFARGVAEL